MSPQDEQTILDWASTSVAPPGSLFLTTADDPAAGPLDEFCRAFMLLVPDLKVINHSEQTFAAPALIIGPHANLAYQAVPQGPELGPFLDALDAGDKPLSLKAPIEDQLKQMVQPADFTLYISPQCPHCPQVVRQLLPLAWAAPHLRLTIVDAALFASRAQTHDVRSVPTLIVDDQFRWTGLLDLEEVLSVCLERDPGLISPTSLRRIIENGDADRVAGMMIEHGAVFPALISLLVDEKWSVRLGAMVTVEYLADEAPHLADHLVEMLWQDFDRYSPQVQGDVAHVFGTIGSAITQAHLKTIAAGSFDKNVRQAAVEALDD